MSRASLTFVFYYLFSEDECKLSCQELYEEKKCVLNWKELNINQRAL